MTADTTATPSKGATSPSMIARLKPRICALKSCARYLPYGIAAILCLPPDAEAQTAQTVEGAGISIIQYGVDIMTAGAGFYGLFLMLRGFHAMSKSGAESGGGRTGRGHSVVSDIGSGFLFFCAGVVVYILKNQFFGGGSASPTLTAPNINPSLG